MHTDELTVFRGEIETGIRTSLQRGNRDEQTEGKRDEYEDELTEGKQRRVYRRAYRGGTKTSIRRGE